MVIFCDDFRLDYLCNEGHAENAGQYKGDPGTDGEADGGVNRPRNGTIEITADETRRFPGMGAAMTCRICSIIKATSSKG